MNSLANFVLRRFTPSERGRMNWKAPVPVSRSRVLSPPPTSVLSSLSLPSEVERGACRPRPPAPTAPFSAPSHHGCFSSPISVGSVSWCCCRRRRGPRRARLPAQPRCSSLFFVACTARMSWIQSAINHQSEDVFDEDANEMDLAQKEWKNCMQKRVKEGYTEGVEVGKEVTLQQGFNQGYQEAARTMFICGQLKGTISALSSWCQCRGCSSAVQNEMSDLLSEVQKYEEYLLKELNRVQSQPHVEDLTDIMEDMDVSHQCSGATDTRVCENAIEFSGHCRTSSGHDSLQNECCRRAKESIGVTMSSLACIKEKTATLVAQLGLSQDTIEHIHLLQT